MRALEGRGALGLASGRELVWRDGRNKRAMRSVALMHMKRRDLWRVAAPCPNRDTGFASVLAAVV